MQPTTHIGILSHAFRKVQCRRPFDIDALAILPKHLHVF
jgi:REP element-mobilizing transposase RayT